MARLKDNIDYTVDEWREEAEQREIDISDEYNLWAFIEEKLREFNNSK